MLALNRKLQHAIWQNNFSATPSRSTFGTRVTAHATPHSKGAWTTLMTTTYDVYGFWLGVNGSSTATTQTDQMLDIAIGAAQENIIVPEYLCGWRGGSATVPTTPWQWMPIFIPRGVLVSARLQALITVDTLDVVMSANGGASALPGPLFSGCDAYGTVIAASQGTSHTPGNTGTESTAADIGTTMSKHYGAVMLGLGGTMTNTAMSNLAYHWELVIGGTAICEWWEKTDGSESIAGPFPPVPFSCSVPSGTQLQVKAECEGTAQAQDVAFYSFY